MPRANLVLYHGVFAPNSSLRSSIIPKSAIQLALPEVCVLDEVAVQDPDVGLKGPLRSRPLAPSPVRTNYTWADLLRRVFEFDVLVCPE